MASPVIANQSPNYTHTGSSERTADKDKKGPVIVRTFIETDGKKPIHDKDIPLLSYNFSEKRWETVGGAEEQNANLNSKYDPSLKDKAKTGMRVDCADWQDVYREYTDGRYIKEMPKNCFFNEGNDDKLSQIQKIYSDALHNFFSGKGTPDDIAKAFEDVVRKTKDLLYERHQTSGENLADNKKIIQDTLFEFRRDAVTFAVSACYKEGEAKYGYNAVRQGAYYNSDYHYLSKDAIDAIEKTALALGDSLPSDPVDLNEWQTYAPSMNEMYSSFNSRWSWANGTNSSRAEITNLSETPPKDVAFFYHNKGTESTVEFMINDNSQTVKAPFDDAKGVSKFNLLDLFKLQFDDSEYQQSLSWFFESVSIFSYTGYVKTHNMGYDARA